MENWLKTSMEWNGNLDKFIEVNRGQHLLSTGWSIFVCQKNLVSGDAVLFLRYIYPDHVNPAEFLADLISIDYSSSESVGSSWKRIDSLVGAFSQHN